MKALVVWGGWEGHEPKQCAERFVPWLRKEGFEVTVSASLDSEAMTLVQRGMLWASGAL